MATHPETSSNLILQAIRSSGLNFCCQETPYSIHITLRKSFTKSWSSQTIPESGPATVKVESTPDLERLTKERNKFSDAFVRVKQDLVDALEHCEENNNVIENLEETKIRQEQTNKLLESKLDNLKKNCDENILTKVERIKNLEQENNELKERIKEKNKETKSLVKDMKDLEHNSEKKLKEMKTKIKNLETSKALKLVEEKSDKVEIQQLQNRLRTAESIEAKLEFKVNELETKFQNFQVATVTKTSQTDQHPEIPYKVTSSLPPIFSSQLCFSSPPIHFLSRSLPRLDKIKWCQPEEYEVDDMDEYLNDQYEQDIKDFYTEARENARARKLEKT